MNTISVNAYAKINLSIDVLGKRSDGYHDIRTVMHQIGIKDHVTVSVVRAEGAAVGAPAADRAAVLTAAEGLTADRAAVLTAAGALTADRAAAISLTASFEYKDETYAVMPRDENNLAVRAARLFIKSFAPEFNGEILIHIDKHIPIAAGLAGGSADAAAVILALARLFRGALSTPGFDSGRSPTPSLRDLMELGVHIGADVPFCIMGQAALNESVGFTRDPAAAVCALAEGIGERLTPLPPLRAWVLVAKPPVAVSTAEIYSGFDAAPINERPDTDALIEGLRTKNYAKISKNMANVLEIVALKEYPEIDKIMCLLSANIQSEKILMSGSGSAVFALFKDKRACESAAAKMADKTVCELFRSKLMRKSAFEQLDMWLEQTELDDELRDELEALKKADESGADGSAADEINDRFYRELEFGTGGMRGILGAGSNRMNVYTVRRITQGLADYINEKTGSAAGNPPTVAISYDNRINSERFAFETACVLLANGVGVYIYPALAPTPALSFAVRYYGCAAGVMITASHNTKEYNGYKVYDPEGEQSLPDEADDIAAHIDRLDLFRDVKTLAPRFHGDYAEKLKQAEAYESAPSSARLCIIPDKTLDAYINAVLALSTGKRDFSRISIVYSPLHGTGNVPVRRVLEAIGLKAVHVVEEQVPADGSFPTCSYPNPEKKEALAMSLALCDKLGKAGKAPELLMATDPDCDRVGVAVLHEGEYKQLTGNETGVLLLDFICASRKAAGTMPVNPVAVKTIVSSPMASAAAREYGVEMLNVLTGFKFIGEQISLLEKKGEASRYIFGFEESCGYMSGVHVRDKDAVNACMLIAELAADCKEKGTTLIGRMNELYERYGFYESSLMEFTMAGESGMERIGRIMTVLRDGSPDKLFRNKLAETADYLTSKKYLFVAGGEETLTLPKSDVLEYVFENGNTIIVRPSGTEPKLKIYLTALGKTKAEAASETAAMRAELNNIVEGIA
jgi:phosphoglucomutase